MPHIFIAGTDTGVGKTWFTCWLICSWRAKGQAAIGLKPISSGDRTDAERLRQAGGNAFSLDVINPVHLREPAAPLIAARAENRIIDFLALNRAIGKRRESITHLAVEGVGGWRVPLGPDYEVRDWARDLALPVVVVALNRLGAINHTLLTVESIHSAGLTCAGIVLNEGPVGGPDLPDFDFARSRNAGLLRDLLRLPVFEFDRRAQAAGEVPVWLR